MPCHNAQQPLSMSMPASLLQLLSTKKKQFYQPQEPPKEAKVWMTSQLHGGQPGKIIWGKKGKNLNRGLWLWIIFMGKQKIVGLKHRSLTFSECATFDIFLGFSCRTLKKSPTFYEVKSHCPIFKVLILSLFTFKKLNAKSFCHFFMITNRIISNFSDIFLGKFEK